MLRPLLYMKGRGRPPAALAVVLPLAPDAWRGRRNIVAASGVAGGAGGALVAYGATGHTGALVVGIVVVVAVVAARVRFDGRQWVQVWLKPGGEEIVVTNTSTAFDEGARRLFIQRAPG
jgi:drug/metabolite transporter (DMT)-like permease